MTLRCLFFLALLGAGMPAHAFPEYYEISQQAEAQKEATERNLSLAWVGSFPEYLTGANMSTGAQLTQMIMRTLKGRVVIIFFDGRNMAPVPQNVHLEFHQQDDGPLPNGANWTSPKVAFTNASVTEMLVRVSYTQMTQEGEGALNSALQIIRTKERAAAAQQATTNEAPQIPAQGGRSGGELVGGISNAMDFIDVVAEYRLPIIAVGLAVFAGFAGFIAFTRKK